MMTNNQNKMRPAYMGTAWFAGLMEEIRQSNKTAVARKLGFDRSTISALCNGLGPYGSGKADPKNIELAYRREYEQLTCPHTHTQVGISHCREIALRAAPTHNPLQMQQWQACQRCEYKPALAITPPAAAVAKVSDVKQINDKVRAGADGSHDRAFPQLRQDMQQAGIIDKVTLPLPEVGAPQIAEA